MISKRLISELLAIEPSTSALDYIGHFSLIIILLHNLPPLLIMCYRLLFACSDISRLKLIEMKCLTRRSLHCTRTVFTVESICLAPSRASSSVKPGYMSHTATSIQSFVLCAIRSKMEVSFWALSVSGVRKLKELVLVEMFMSNAPSCPPPRDHWKRSLYKEPGTRPLTEKIQLT